MIISDTMARMLRRYRRYVTGLLPVALVVFVWVAREPPISLVGCAVGTSLVIAGAGLRIWAAGHLGTKREELATTGPFAHTRHPLYMGSLIAGLGFCAASGAWWSFALIACLFPLFYFPAIISEEKALARRHGERYEEYRRQAPAFWWRVGAHSGGRRFSLLQVKEHEEHLAVLQIAVLLTLFWIRLAVL